MTEYERICHHYPIKAKRPNSTSVRKIKQRLGYQCPCGENDPACIDLHHSVPLYKGGTNDISNFCCKCANCHRKEHAKLRK